VSDAAPAAHTSRRLGVSTKLFYGSGSIAFGVKDNGFNYFLLIFYNQVIGMPSETVGLAIMIALIVDAFIDPIVGQASDNLRTKWGRRHPFMYFAALPVAVSYLLLWNPPAWSHEALFFYLIGVAILIRTFITLYEIPSSALAAELTTEYDERTRLLSYRYLFGWIGGLTMFFAGLRIFLTPDADHPVGQLNPAGYSNYGIAAAILMFVAIMVSATGTHREIKHLPVNPPGQKLSLGVLAREMFGTLAHRSFLQVLVASLFTAMASGLVLSINIYMNTYFWEFSSAQISNFTFASLISALLSFAAAPHFSKAFGKRGSAIALMLVSLVVGVAPIVLRLLGVFPENGHPAVFPSLFVMNSLSTAASITAAILASSMIADVVEDSELRTGRRSEGLFFSAAAFVNKAVSGIGIFATSMIITAIHFPQHAQPGQVPAEVIRNLGLVYVPTLATLYALAAFFTLGYKITRASHEESLRKLAAAQNLREEGEPAGTTAKLD
jgi:Na+/melibiose symporter-like transporter